MKLLSTDVIDKYDYLKTNAKVKEYMSRFEDDYYRYVSVLPPSITSHLSEIKVQTSFNNTSPIESYVIKKTEKEEKFLQTLDTILRVLASFNEEEQRYFKGVFFLGNSESVISEELQCADKRIRHIKKSSIIKFALAMDLAILK